MAACDKWHASGQPGNIVCYIRVSVESSPGRAQLPLFRRISMKKLAGGFRSFVKDEDGATMVEYGIMIALIAAICVGIVTTLGTQIKAAFTTTSGALPAA